MKGLFIDHIDPHQINLVPSFFALVKELEIFKWNEFSLRIFSYKKWITKNFPEIDY